MSSAWIGLRNDLEITELPHYAINKLLPSDSFYTSEETANKCFEIYKNKLSEENLDFSKYTFISVCLLYQTIGFQKTTVNKVVITICCRYLCLKQLILLFSIFYDLSPSFIIYCKYVVLNVNQVAIAHYQVVFFSY